MVVVFVDKESPQTCAFRGVTWYIYAAHSVGWNLAKDHLFPLIIADGRRGAVTMSTQRMTAALQGHRRMAGVLDHLNLYSFRVGGSVTKSFAGTAVDEIMTIGRWKPESIAKYYIGSITSTGVQASKKTQDHSYAHANDLSLSHNRESDFSACTPKHA